MLYLPRGLREEKKSKAKLHRTTQNEIHQNGRLGSCLRDGKKLNEFNQIDQFHGYFLDSVSFQRTEPPPTHSKTNTNLGEDFFLCSSILHVTRRGWMETNAGLSLRFFVQNISKKHITRSK